MSEQRKLTDYEIRMLAAARNLKNYCFSHDRCEGCIFRKGDYDCRLVDPWGKPAGWTLYMIKYRVNEERGD